MLEALKEAAELAKDRSTVAPDDRQTIRIEVTADGLMVVGTYRDAPHPDFNHRHHVGWRELDQNPRFAERAVLHVARGMDAQAFAHGHRPVRPDTFRPIG